MKHFRLALSSLLFGLFIFLRMTQTSASKSGSVREKLFAAHNTKNPTHVRKIHLYSKQGHYMAILENGTVVAKLERDSPDTVLEMHSYSVNIKRIRRPNSDFWLAIDRSGRIRTRKRKERKDTLFYEDHDEGWLWYQNYHGFILAFKKNFQPKHNVTIRINPIDKKTNFLIMPVKNKSKRKRSIGSLLRSKAHGSSS